MFEHIRESNSTIFKREIWKLLAAEGFNDVTIFFLFFIFLFPFFFYIFTTSLVIWFRSDRHQKQPPLSTQQKQKRAWQIEYRVPAFTRFSLSRRNDDTWVSRRLPRRNDHEERERVNDSPFLLRCSLPISVPVPLFPSAAGRNLWGTGRLHEREGRALPMLDGEPPLGGVDKEGKREDEEEAKKRKRTRKRKKVTGRGGPSLRRSFGSRLPTKLPDSTVFRSFRETRPLAHGKEPRVEGARGTARERESTKLDAPLEGDIHTHTYTHSLTHTHSYR